MTQPQPVLVPSDALRELLIEILMEFMAASRAEVIAFAASGPDQLAIQTHMSPLVMTAFRNQGTDVANAMDTFFGQYGVTWNPAGYYNWPSIPAQQARWNNVRVEDINSTRHFVVNTQQDAAHTIYNLTRMIRFLGTQPAAPGVGLGRVSKDFKDFKDRR